MLEIKPLAFDSLGVRSMATFISTPDINIIIDPSASLAPLRYGLPPHELEVRALHNSIEVIKNFISFSDVIVITHYHYDHHDPGKLIPLELLTSKELLVKDPVNMINVSQRIRASKFLKGVKEVGADIKIADGREFKYGKTLITISKPQQHGNNDKLGYVLMVSIRYEGYSIIFSSDIEGFLNDYSMKFIEGADVAIIDGPPTYLINNAYSEDEIRACIENLAILSKKVGKLVIDHHMLRDLNYRNIFNIIKDLSGVNVITAAEFLGLEPNLLEARRRELYKNSSQSKT
ncbi:MAG: MBL fold metallo-hydrolase [Sulfolobales archaeon]|jgi:predicted metallo-beta-lactamase superfamily hydrolase|nr:MBL fold metallo-hydrolase [Desulfurococcaceae archaeon]